MGYPTFTFETDDEQFLLGTLEPLSERLGEELDVMHYLIENVWYWRARLVVDSLEVGSGEVRLSVSNQGHASTSNATLLYFESEDSTEFWLPGLNEPIQMGDGMDIHELVSEFNFSALGSGFSVNATNTTVTMLDFTHAPISNNKGIWALYYQKRVIDSSMWTEESIDESVVVINVGSSSFLPAPSMLTLLLAFAVAAINQRSKSFDN